MFNGIQGEAETLQKLSYKSKPGHKGYTATEIQRALSGTVKRGPLPQPYLHLYLTGQPHHITKKRK
jgi:hypothetical protein